MLDSGCALDFRQHYNISQYILLQYIMYIMQHNILSS